MCGSHEQRTTYFYYSMMDRKVFNYAGEFKYYGRIIYSSNEMNKIKRGEQMRELKMLLNDCEHLEQSACEAAAAAEREYEQTVLNELLLEIRQQHSCWLLFYLLLVFGDLLILI